MVTITGREFTSYSGIGSNAMLVDSVLQVKKKWMAIFKVMSKESKELMSRPWIAMQFTDGDLCEVESLIEDDAWIFEQKFDGTRGLCVVNENGVWWPAANGVGKLSHTAATQHFATLDPILSKLMEGTEFGEIVLDGEIMIETGEYHVWDIVFWKDGNVLIVSPMYSDFETRRKLLESLYKRLPPDGPVKLVRQAVGSKEKLDLWNAVKVGGGEGVMAKRLDSNYDLGKRVKHSVKLKFVKTADVIVLEVNRPDLKHGNFVLGVYDEDSEYGHVLCIGSCSAIGKDPDVKVGDVIEVAYLYWTGESMYQPRMVRVRDDKLPTACLISQFPEYYRTAR
jgi:ATP-dependent DNA ligase